MEVAGIELDSVGGLVTVAVIVLLALGLATLSGLWAIGVWVVLVLVVAATAYFGGRRLYRYLDRQFLSPNRRGRAPPRRDDNG